MSTKNRSEDVPLALWQPPRPAAGPVRRALAEWLVRSYSPDGGLVVDLAPAGDDVAGAAVAARRSAVAVVTSPGLGGAWPDAGLDGFAGAVDLAVALPAESALATGRPVALAGCAVAVVSRQSAKLLRPGGVLVIGFVGSPEGVDPLGTAVEAATLAGLDYLQHVVALGHGDVGQHGHADLLVFGRGRG